MSITRKWLALLLAVFLAAALVLQAGAFTVFGASKGSVKHTITISNVDTSRTTGRSGVSATVIKTKDLARYSFTIVKEQFYRPVEYVISGRDISVQDGKYNYRLVIRSDKTLTFDNDLEIYYQGVDGKYKLHYDIDKTDNHTMIVTGVFENIIVSSPLMQKLSASDRKWILSHISKDTYFYQLVLKTKNGFSFVNSLRFLLDGKKRGYSVRYSYNLRRDRQTLRICRVS